MAFFVPPATTPEKRAARQSAEYAIMESHLKERAVHRQNLKSHCKTVNCPNFTLLKKKHEENDSEYALSRVMSIDHKAEKTAFKATIYDLNHQLQMYKDGILTAEGAKTLSHAKVITTDSSTQTLQEPIVSFNKIAAVQISQLTQMLKTSEDKISEYKEQLKPKLVSTTSTQTGWFNFSVQTQTEPEVKTKLTTYTKPLGNEISIGTQTAPKMASIETQTVLETTDVGVETIPLRNMYCFQVVKLRFKLAYNRIWLSKYDKSIEALIRLKMVTMRARAEERINFEPEEPSSSGAAPAWQQIDSLQSALQNEVAQINSQLVTIDLELTASNELSNKAAEDARRLQTAIDELRSETLEMQISNAADLNLAKKEIHGIQRVLAEVRQSTLEIENGFKTIPLDSTKTTLSILEKSFISSSVQECLEKLPPSIKPDQMSEAFKIERAYQDEQMKELKAVIEANTMNELKKLQLDEESRLKGKDTSFLKDENVGTHLDAACQTGFTVDNYEYSSLIRAAGEIHKFDTTLIKLEGKAQNVGLELDRQEQVMQEARSLISELRLITRDNLDAYAKLKRADDDIRLVRIEAERRQTKASNKKARLQVARHMSKERESQIKAEINNTTPKIVEFVREWNSLQAGDIFIFRGLHLVVDETFNPSIRIAHTGQDGDKWEAQKYANGSWYDRGIFDLKR
jgi:hypothetical protein